jgi:hypothetical protein
MSPGYLDILRKKRTVETTECGKSEVENKEVLEHSDPLNAKNAFRAVSQNAETIQVPSPESTIPLGEEPVSNPPFAGVRFKRFKRSKG